MTNPISTRLQIQREAEQRSELLRDRHEAKFPDDDLEKAKKWKNLIFLTDSRALVGDGLYDTEAQAKFAADHDANLIKYDLFGRFVADGVEFDAQEFSHFMQIPWQLS
jgi:hypothetical protein